MDDRLPAGPPAALLHTETLGRLVDRMAMTWAYWRQLQQGVPSSRGASVGHEAQTAMDEVALVDLLAAYDAHSIEPITDLADELRAVHHLIRADTDHADATSRSRTTARRSPTGCGT